ncbi:hypothetical protein BJ165DRAFT_1442192 [Panaeolus papilionaceus]|nr:hypothetical protein BJ165DRAFT_1442192 [Panaeolus papilionaceus]
MIMLDGLFVGRTAEDVKNMLVDELAVTMSALKANPKVYWIWNQRRWCLENIPLGPEEEDESGGKVTGTVWQQGAWDKEIFVAEKMLDADPRNFHAWDYRRYCLSQMPNPRAETQELQYTYRKIAGSLSNFSAWHQRSKVLGSLWSQGKLNEAKSREQEFDLVRNAMYTDPDNQGVWMYHRWLVGTDGSRSLLEREIGAIQELLEDQCDSKWCMESIVHYKRMIVFKYANEEDVGVLSQECREMLSRLIELDPARRRRYESLCKSGI